MPILYKDQEKISNTSKNKWQKNDSDEDSQLSNEPLTLQQDKKGHTDRQMKGLKQFLADRKINKGHISPLENKGLLVRATARMFKYHPN
ncbi:hypothetical protein [Photorhabdus namnaonensis]|uniref:Uncharacterized protein n=1 Tax=Photorhabdus namnaonensis TaxID=1851568 RepID=A0A1B8YGP7_9GAMM|nr:hypothetical protein [Photorhabdus namnaonensis]OCA54300.1 hypothetical protein Phpb_02744 [Photorhabdus namnaonensis]